jgi:hypothetical protein
MTKPESNPVAPPKLRWRIQLRKPGEHDAWSLLGIIAHGCDTASGAATFFDHGPRPDWPRCVQWAFAPGNWRYLLCCGEVPAAPPERPAASPVATWDLDEAVQDAERVHMVLEWACVKGRTWLGEFDVFRGFRMWRSKLEPSQGSYGRFREALRLCHELGLVEVRSSGRSREWRLFERAK